MARQQNRNGRGGRGGGDRSGRQRRGGGGRGHNTRSSGQRSTQKRREKLSDYKFYIGSATQGSDFNEISKYLINHIRKSYINGNNIPTALEQREEFNISNNEKNLTSTRTNRSELSRQVPMRRSAHAKTKATGFSSSMRSRATLTSGINILTIVRKHTHSSTNTASLHCRTRSCNDRTMNRKSRTIRSSYSMPSSIIR